MRDLKAIRDQIRATQNIPGGPGVLHVWPTFTPNAFADDLPDTLLWSWNPDANGGEIVLLLGSFPIHFTARPGEPEREPPPPPSLIFVPGPPPPLKMKHWGLTKLGPGVWGVEPSVHLPGAFHGYVTLCDVPDPAPWEAP